MSPDVVVIGSGFGGAIAAFRLALAGKRVLVLERGPWVATPDLRQTQDPRWLVNIFRSYRGFAPPGVESMDILVGSCVGGGSVVYSGASLRAPSMVFGRQGWWPGGYSRASLDPYYALVERALPVNRLAWSAPDEPWREVPKRGGVWGAALAGAGYTVEPLRQAVTDCLHCGWCNAGCKFGKKNDLLQNYLPAALRLGASIEPLAAVQWIEPALGGFRVRYRKLAAPTQSIFDPRAPMHEVTAPEVVLAAGTVGSATILMRSRPFLPLVSPHVGLHLSGNGDLPLAAFLPGDPTEPYKGVAMDTVSYQWLASDGFIVISQHMLPLSTAVLGRAGGSGPPTFWGLDRKHDFRDYGTQFVGLAVIGLDDSEGQVYLDEGQVNQALLALGVRYQPTEATRARWGRAREVLRAVVEGAGGRFVDLADELPVRNQTAHPLGTARMSDGGPGFGVVSPDLDLYGYPGIRVVDGSVIPSALAVNPSLTIAAVAERAMLRATGVALEDAPTPADVLGA